MRKYYSSDSHISINVVLSNGKSTRIPFVPLSSGGSVYFTSITEIQEALERHYRFGSLFNLDGAENEENADANNEVVGEVAEESSEDVGDSGGVELLKVEVSDLGEAKNYLADKFGISRTSLKSEKKILEAATANGIEFVGL